MLRPMIVMLLLVPLFAWLVISFVVWSFDPSEWAIGGRIISVFFVLLIDAWLLSVLSTLKTKP